MTTYTIIIVITSLLFIVAYKLYLNIPVKFSVKIVHYLGKYYTVQYANYRIFPKYHPIQVWTSTAYSNLGRWHEKLFTVTEAEEFANNLNSIDDVNDYHQIYEKEKQEYIKKNKPYTSKMIKP